MRIGLIARADNTGLGMLSWEFFTNLRESITKVVIVDCGAFKIFPERFKIQNLQMKTQGELGIRFWEEFLREIDILLAIETPYNWIAFLMAKHAKVKTVLIPMFEGSAKPLEFYPSLIACPSTLDYESFRGEPSRLELIPLPVNRQRIKYKKRTRAITFLHNVGHGGLHGRTGTTELLDTIPIVKNKEINFIINSQVSLDYTKDSRLKVNVNNIENYWDLWNEGDVFILPAKFGMISMPVQEALAAGMLVLTADIPPFKGWLPDSWLIPHEVGRDVKFSRRDILYVDFHPLSIAQIVVRWAGKNIEKESEQANKLAESISWEKLKPRWMKLFESL